MKVEIIKNKWGVSFTEIVAVNTSPKEDADEIILEFTPGSGGEKHCVVLHREPPYQIEVTDDA